MRLLGDIMIVDHVIDWGNVIAVFRAGPDREFPKAT